MAVLGVSQIDFSSKTYESFISDAKEIAKIRPTDILVWGCKPEVYTSDRFEWIKDRYWKSCIIHKKEEYSAVSLEWANSLAKNHLPS